MKNVSENMQLKMEGNVKVNIPENVIQKIQYLCTVIPNLEWSGILFYTLEGTIKKSKEMSITLKDILPMDKGTATSTEFIYDKRYVEFLMNGGEERLSWKSGLIHSHNNMGVFYSGTDEDEIKTNSKAHNFYLSVVVNNRLDIIGKIGILGTAETEVKTHYKGLDEEGNPYTISPTTLKVKSEKLYYIDCDMIYEKPESIMEEEFMNNVNTILNKPVNTSIYNPPVYSPLNNQGKGYPSTFKSEKNAFRFNPYGYNQYDDDFYDNIPVTKKTSYSKPPKNKKKDSSKYNKMEEDLKKSCEEFLIMCFSIEEEDFIEPFPSLEDVLDEQEDLLLEESMTIPEILEDFSSNFLSIFEQHFYNTIYSSNVIMNTILEILEEYEDQYSFVKDLKNFISKL